MYLSNYCVNKCAYCSYNIENKINRKTLTMEEIEEEAKAISSTGLRHILILTGESNKEAPVSYIIEAVQVLKKYFDSISIEIYPLSVEDYTKLVVAGVDGMTIYQEVYNEKIYDKIHLAGPKKNYRNRIEAPERVCQAKIRSVNVGALLGLDDWRKEAYFTGLHANFLQNNYPEMEVGVSVPRIRPHVGVFEDMSFVDDKNLLQIILAFRIFLPRIGIAVSTRERQSFRDNLIPLGITKMSAGVSTEVGGHTSTDAGESQFEISDNRSVEEVKQAIIAKNYKPVFKDWMAI
jgi:2-iminoacetate synthase